jgi:hypothetical chaperone protein
MAAPAAIGLDFGTTNSSLAWVGPEGEPVLVHFAADGGATPTFRSVLYFERGEDGRGPLATHAGPRAIEAYLASEEKTGRLIQSLKSFLASRLFRATSILGRSHRLEDLLALLLRALREEAETSLGAPVESAMVGRPVRFVRAADEDDEALALRRLRAALGAAGFHRVAFEYEPVGAAHHYERGLEHDECVLIADFGGGTSDFSLLRVGPGFRADPARRRREGVLGHEGVGVAGDAFDGKLVRHLVAPALGRGDSFRSHLGRVLPAPVWIYNRLERWHHVSFLKSKRTLEVLHDLRREALEPGKIERLLELVERDLGFLLFRAVEATKHALSRERSARFRFAHEELAIEAPVGRADFEAWIAEELAAIAGAVDALFARARLPYGAVDRVFLTGGSSFVPAVRRIFEERFGAERLRGGDEFTSVAAGLSLRALEEAG